MRGKFIFLISFLVLAFACTSYADVVIGAEPVEPTVPFSVGAVGDITVCNDDRCGPDNNRNGSGLEARNTADPRRDVILISYDISSLKGRGPVSNVSLNSFSHGC